MPLFYQQNINEFTKIAIWQIQEPEAFFLEKVAPARQVTHPHKRLQHLAGRYLLQYLYPDFPHDEIAVATTRKPFLPGEQYHFSISHCGNFAAAIVSSYYRAGIDIECYTDKVLIVKDKFLTTVEQSLLAKTFTQTIDITKAYTTLWCCKEAVYKWWSLGGLDFKENIQLQTINAQQKTIEILFEKNGIKNLLSIRYLWLNDACIAWLINI